jgi:hypothetical protein
MGQLLLPREGEAFRERVEDAGEPEATEHGLEVVRDRIGGACWERSCGISLLRLPRGGEREGIVGGGPQIAAARQDPRRGPRGRQRREFEEPGEAVDTEHLGGERGLTGGADAGGAIAADQAEQGVGLAHPGPGQIAG